VTSIDRYAFWLCKALTNIDFPNSLTSIGEKAFNYCTNLSSITIPDGAAIFNEAFSSCSNLKSINLGSGIIFNGISGNNSNAFTDCESIEVVTCRSAFLPEFHYYQYGWPQTTTTNDNLFSNSEVQYATLIVPDEAYDAYSTTAPWSEFGTILKMSEASVVTANSYTREYGDPNPTFEYTSAQTLNGAPAIS